MSLELYRPLGSNDDKLRLEAVTKLTVELSEIINGSYDMGNQKKVDYALNRLTRGIASGRESARLGFSLVFVEFAALVLKPENTPKWGIGFDKILAAVVKNTTPEGGASGVGGATKQEERDACFGRLFGLKSLAQAGILQNEQQWASVLSSLLEIAAKKPWLREPCSSVVAQCIEKFPTEGGDKWASETYAKLIESGLAKTSDGVPIWLVLKGRYPKVKPMATIWANDNPLHPSSLAMLAKALKDAKIGEEEEETRAKQKGSWNPRLPFVWGLMVKIYGEEENANFKGLRKGMAEFGEWWKIAVDENLFAANASDERKFWGFQLFIEVLKSDNRSLFQATFTKNFIRCLMNQLSDASRYLHKIAEKAVKTLQTFGAAHPECVYIIVESLLQKNGTPNFDSLTKTKTVEKLLGAADAEGTEKLVDLFLGIILKPNETETKAVEVRRQWAADQLLNLARSSKSKDAAWITTLVEAFATYGHFNVPKAKPEFSTKTQEVLRSRLSSCLSSLFSAEDAEESWPYKAVKRIFGLKKKGKFEFAIELDELIEEKLALAQKRLEKINKKKLGNPSDKAKYTAFELLYSLVTLQILGGDADSLSILDELEFCYDKAFKSKSKSKSKSSSDDDENDQDPGDILVEILLTFLSKQSQLLKKLAHQVFRSFAPQFTAQNLCILFDVLDTNENAVGQSELFERDGGEMEDDESEDEDEDEEDDDVEMVDAMDEDDDEEDSDEDEDEDDEDEDDEDDEEAAKLDAALAQALGTHILKPGEDDSDDSGSDMDDDAMMAMDEQLANIFKGRKNAPSKKQEAKEAKEAMINLKTRVLELLELYIKDNSTNPLSLLIIVPILRLIRTTSTKQISDKAAALLRALCKAKEHPVLSDADADSDSNGWALLSDIHKEMLKGGSNLHSSVGSSASLLLVKLLCGLDRRNVDKCFMLYAETMSAWALDRKVGIQPAFFTDLVNWSNSARKGSLDV